jgi:4-amino-4-deoxy-L-arabinose transferase-like glycosyltransferase
MAHTDSNIRNFHRSVISGMVSEKSIFLILTLGIAVRIWHINWGLPELYEEAFPLTVSWKFWNWLHTGFDFNPHFFNYPALTFYLNFFVQVVHYVIGYIIGSYPNLQAFQQTYETNPTTLVILARLLSVLFDVGTICVVCYLGKKYAGKGIGLTAAVLVAINPLLIKQAHLVNVDSPLTFFTMLSLFFIYHIHQQPRSKWYVLAGISIGLAAASKYNGALLLLVLVFAHLLKSGSFNNAIRLLRSGQLAKAIALAVGTFLLINPYILLSLEEFAKDFSFEESHMTAGHLGVDPTISTVAYYLLKILPTYFGWMLLVIIAISIVYFIVRREKPLLILIVFLLIYLYVICTWKMRAERYLLPTIPVLILIGSIGIGKGWKAITSFSSEKRFLPFIQSSAFRIAVGVIVGVLIVIQPLSSLWQYQNAFGLPDTRIIAKKWIQQHLPRGAVIATVPLGIEFPDSLYRMFMIPFLTVNTERVASFYDTRWYEDLDLVIGSDFDYNRYLQDPQRYQEFLQYYDSLHTRWTLAYEVKPVENQPGPTLWLFTPPDSLQHGLFATEVFQRFNNAPESSRVSNFLKTLELILVTKGKLEKAAQLGKEIVSVETNNPDAHKTLAQTLYHLGKFEEALMETQIYLRLKPDDAEIFSLEGNMLLALNRLDKAEESFKKALVLNKYLEYVYDNLLMIYVQKKDKQNAINILTQHLKILPANSEKAKLVVTDLNRLKNLP